MFNKIGKYIRLLHRYLTPFFVIVTIVYNFNSDIIVLGRIQKILMLTLAVTGSYLFVQIYYRKYKSKRRKTVEN